MLVHRYGPEGSRLKVDYEGDYANLGAKLVLQIQRPQRTIQEVPTHSLSYVSTLVRTRREAMAFQGTTTKCTACAKTVYLVDKLTADNRVYHRACFRCHHCKGTLKVRPYPPPPPNVSCLSETSIRILRGLCLLRMFNGDLHSVSLSL
ncbi:hypothetical protein BHE74_00039658 [Ensete ventricosum]|nr:hypothetical protein BHE74_00039658 [Ensete ventricosum]